MNQVLESFPKQRMIVHDHDPFCFRRIAFRVLICGPHYAHRFPGLGLWQHNRLRESDSLNPSFTHSLLHAAVDAQNLGTAVAALLGTVSVSSAGCSPFFASRDGDTPRG